MPGYLLLFVVSSGLGPFAGASKEPRTVALCTHLLPMWECYGAACVTSLLPNQNS